MPQNNSLQQMRESLCIQPSPHGIMYLVNQLYLDTLIVIKTLVILLHPKEINHHMKNKAIGNLQQTFVIMFSSHLKNILSHYLYYQMNLHLH